MYISACNYPLYEIALNLAMCTKIKMRDIYTVKYPNYDANKNKVEVKILRIPLGLNRRAD